LVEALQATFDADYPEQDFRRLRVGIEFPVAQADYPGLWINYGDTSPLVPAGIHHIEIVETNTGDYPVTRWRFAGEITITAVALSSLERDRLFDELVRTFAFAREEDAVSAFRNKIEVNDLIAMNINFDNLRPTGDNAAPGTPWETDDFVYEKSITMDVIGEFVSSPATGQLVNLSQIIVKGYVEGTPEPAFTGNPSSDVLDPGAPGSVPTGFRVSVPSDDDGWV
jgi:hypothetical protein